MQEYKVNIQISREEIIEAQVSEGTTLRTLAEKYQEHYKDKIVLAKFNHKLRELNKEVASDGEVTFITMTERDGKRTYRRSAILLLQKAVHNLWGKTAVLRVMHSLGEGYYCEIEGKVVSRIELLVLKEEMLRLVDDDIVIRKNSVKTDEAVELFKELGLTEKEKLMSYRRSSRVNLYDLDGMSDYHYGFMVPSTVNVRPFIGAANHN